MFKKYKKIIIAIVIIVALFFLYSAFFRGSGSEDEGLVSVSVENTEDSVTQSLLATLLEIRSVTLDESIFNDPSFNALENFSQPVPPQPVGRPNPFLPIGTDPQVSEPEQSTEIQNTSTSNQGETGSSQQSDTGGDTGNVNIGGNGNSVNTQDGGVNIQGN